MPRNTSVALEEHLAAFVDRQVRDGRYDTAGDVLRAGLRLLEEHEERIRSLRAALIEGEESGVATPLDFDAFIAERRSPMSG